MKVRLTLIHKEEFILTPESLDLEDNASDLVMLTEATRLYKENPELVYEFVCESDQTGTIKVEQVLPDGNTRWVTDG